MSKIRKSTRLAGSIKQATICAALSTELVASALKECAWKIEGDKGAASLLAMPPSTLRERIGKYGIEHYPAEEITTADYKRVGP